MMNKLLLMLVMAVFSVMAGNAADVLPVIKITTKGGAAIGSEKYVNGTIEITDENGKVVTLNSKFKMRGATALSYPQKPSLNVKFRDADGTSLDTCVLGIRKSSKVILDAMAIDRICMRNRVAMDIWNAYSKLPYKSDFDGRSGTEGRFVEVYINDIYKGVYCFSDMINRSLLNLKKYDTENGKVRGVLYKSGTTDISGAQEEAGYYNDYENCISEYHNAWELKEPEDYYCKEAWAPLLDASGSTLTKDSEGRTVVNSYELVKKYFWIDNLVDYELHILALRIQDNWGNKNHFLSIRNIQKDINDDTPDTNGKDTGTEGDHRRFVISPWDLDCSLGGNYDGSFYNGTYTDKYGDWMPADAVKNGGCFPFSYCQGSTEYMNKLKARWAELRTGVYSTKNVNKRLEDYRDLLLNSGAWQRQHDAKVQPKDVDDLSTEIDYIEKWYAERVNILDNYFGTTSGIVAVNAETSDATDGRLYNLSGQVVNDTYRGIVIVNGRKMIKK